MQRFKKMVGYSLYEISNEGTIRKIVTKEIVSQRVHPIYNYRMCDLQDDDLKVHTVYPHKEVARAYIPTRKKGKLYVIHMNGKQQDNRAANLQWATPAEAQIHQLKMGFRKRLGNPELYKYSKYWKARHAKKGSQKSKAKPKISKGKVKLVSKGKAASALKKSASKRSAKSKAVPKAKKQVRKISKPLAKKVVSKKKSGTKSLAAANKRSVTKPIPQKENKRGKRQRIKFRKVLTSKPK